FCSYILFWLFLFTVRRPRLSTLFPYTTLFRSGGVGHGVAVDAVGDVLSGAAGVDPEALTLGGGLGLSVPPVGEVVQFFDAFDARADALDDHPASACAQPLVLTRLRSVGHVGAREFGGVGC